MLAAILTRNENRLHTIITLISANRDAAKRIMVGNGKSPLHTVIELGEIDLIKLFVLCGVDVNQPLTRFGETPLDVAARFGNIEVIRVLCELGAIIKISSKRTPIYYAAKAGMVEAIRVLHELGGIIISCEDIEDPVYIAAMYDHVDVIRILYELGANLTTCTYSKSPAWIAAYNGHVNVLHTLHECGVLFNIPNDENPLFGAIEADQVLAIRCMHALGANIEFNTTGNTSPMKYAAEFGQINSILVLHELGANIHLCGHSSLKSALWIAACNGHIGAVRALHSLGADINACDDRGISPICIATSERKWKMVEALYELGGDINKCTNKGNSPLHIAVKMGSPTGVQVILSLRGIDVHNLNNKNESVVYIAAKENHPTIIHILHSAGANLFQIANSGYSPIGIATYSGNLNTIDVLSALNSLVNTHVNVQALGNFPTESKKLNVLNYARSITQACVSSNRAKKILCDGSHFVGLWDDCNREMAFSLIFDFLCHQEYLKDVLSLRLTSRDAYIERKLTPCKQRIINTLEPDLIEQYLGGIICRYLTTREIGTALYWLFTYMS